jgi:hypothetical protein
MNKVTILPDQEPRHPNISSLPAGTIFKYNDGTAIYIKTNRGSGVINLRDGSFWDSPTDSYNITVLKNISIRSEG